MTATYEQVISGKVRAGDRKGEKTNTCKKL
jgi:hypothetical protein